MKQRYKDEKSTGRPKGQPKDWIGAGELWFLKQIGAPYSDDTLQAFSKRAPVTLSSIVIPNATTLSTTFLRAW